MARKTSPETPAEEAARINAASGDPDGITAEQVANNRRLNQSLTPSFNSGTSGPSINPLAQLVASVSSSISQAGPPSVSSESAKANLDATVGRLGGAVGSGLNSFTAGAQQFASENGATAFAGFGNTVQSNVSNAFSSLQSVAASTSNVTADIAGSLNKLAGGNLASGLQDIATGISKAAGVLNNVLSLVRGANLPAGGELFIKQGSAIRLLPGSKDDWRVRLDANWKLFDSALFKVLENTGGVVWPYLPQITVSTKANYTQIDPTHSNYPFYAYKNSQVDEITITGDFSAETETDAAYWIAATTFFKTATKMFFGNSTNGGNPPVICRLNGYGSSVFDSVPVIVKSFSVDLKDDVNYVRCNVWGTNTWVPILSTITVQVAPIYNRARQRKFSLQDYAKGKTSELPGSGGVGYL